jgi:hypothetical protein
MKVKILNKKINLIFKKSKEPFEKQQKENVDSRYFECPECKNIITLENIDIEIIEFECPICGQKNIFQLPREQSEKKHKESLYVSLLLQVNHKVAIIGLFLIFTSIFLLFLPNPFTIKLSITFLIIGIILPMFFIEKNNLSVKVTFGSIALITILFLITGTDLEIFLILIFLGLFIMKIIIDNYLPTVLKLRMNIIISAFFIIFIALIVKRIINIVSV